MSDSRPIGIFDSGVGGLTVVRKIREILPNEDIIYFGDTARVPYGTKSKETITRFSVENAEFLMTHNVKIVIVACNTASSLSLDFLKRCFKVPILGVIGPGAKGAVGATRNNRIGVIGTHATVASGAYEKAIHKISPRYSVFSRACPLFVPLVEEGWADRDVTKTVARIYLKPVIGSKVDTLILGCTHYPILKNTLAGVMGKGVVLVDSATEVAKETRDILDAGGLLKYGRGKSSHKFFVSDEPSRFIKIGDKFLDERIKCVRKKAD